MCASPVIVDKADGGVRRSVSDTCELDAAQM